MVLNELTEQIGDNDYYLCMNEECDITYYNTKFNVKFNKQQVKVQYGLRKMQILSMLVIAAKSQKIR